MSSLVHIGIERDGHTVTLAFRSDDGNGRVTLRASTRGIASLAAALEAASCCAHSDVDDRELALRGDLET